LWDNTARINSQPVKGAVRTFWGVHRNRMAVFPEWRVLESHQTRSRDQAVAVLEDLLAMAQELRHADLRDLSCSMSGTLI